MLNLIERGGPIMWPLLIVSLISLTILIERAIFLFWFYFNTNSSHKEKFINFLANNRLDDATRLAEFSKDPILSTINKTNFNTYKSFQISFREYSSQLLAQITKGINVLDTAITIAPLLGLLGTVTGLMVSFSNLGSNELDSPTAVTGGISEALIATAFGLLIAIVNLAPFNALSSLETKTKDELEKIGSQLEDLLK